MAATRAEHLAWCKERAFAYLDQGDVANAWASFVSDLRKHPQTAGHAGVELGFLQMLAGGLRTPTEMRDFIEGCW
jgi:hypothetical protein